MSERDGSDVPNRGNWVHDLNLDPRWRVAAGLGTGVIQANQESYMEAAWDQIGDVLEANRRIRQAQYAKFAGERLHARHVVRKAEVSPASLILLQAPVAARLISDGLTIQHRVRQSPLSTALASTALRRSIRPAGRLAQSLKLTEPAAAAALIERANAGIVTAAPPKGVPHDILTPDAIAAAAEKSASGSNALLLVLDRLIARSPLIAGVLALVLVVLAFLILGWIGLLLAFGALAAAWKAIRALRARQRSARRFREERLTPASVDEIPQSSSFTLVEIVDPRTASDIPASRPGGTDSAAAAAFKDALRDQYRLIGKSRAIGQVPERIPLDLARLARDAVTGLDPSVTVPRWIWSGIHLPERIRGQTGETFAEVMAYPEFDLPMYEPLAKAGDDLFVPNLHLVPPDSVTLLKTNQRFIEAYMVGLNHEFARELLWREYPTDQRGSYFRQFWDVRKKVAAAADKTAAREQLKDIKPIHRWPRASDLGDHDNRETGPVAEEELVLVIRGELLKKYPNTIVSAQRAKWRTKNGKPDKSRERELDESQPPMLPLYEARVPPDIYFFGFDLVEDEARGGDEVNDKPGWFFRIEEVPGDARFGFDIERASGQSINVWNDVAWADLAPGLAPNRPLHVAAIPAIALSEPAGEAAEKHEQWTSDRFVALADASAAELAYVALQTPVLMAVHAAELLPPDEEA